MNSRGAIIGRHDVPARSGDRRLAFGEMQEWAEVGEDLDRVESGIVHLNVTSTELHLGNSRQGGR